MLEAQSPAECHLAFPVLAGDAHKVVQKRICVELEEDGRKPKRLFGSQGPRLCGVADHESFLGAPSYLSSWGHNVCEVILPSGC